MKLNDDQLFDLKQWANERYDHKRFRYDVIVECWEDSEYHELAAECRTINGIKRRMKEFAKLQGEVALNQEYEGGW